MAISAGKIDRKPKNATPPAMIGMLSAEFSAHARLTICFQPLSGMSVGFSACRPGSSPSVGEPGGGRCGSGCGGSASALAAAARRAAFSSTRCLMRSTALSRGLVWAISFPLLSGRPVAAVAGDAGRDAVSRPVPGSVAGPGARQLGEGARTGAVDRGLGGGEDRTLQRGRDHDLAHPVLAL